MKITCILTSYNRPKFVRQAIGSVLSQTHQDWELIVVDDSNRMDIERVVEEFDWGAGRGNPGRSRVKVFHTDVPNEERAKVNRLGINVNKGLHEATGDLICFLADDDYYFPTWFQSADDYFAKHRHVDVGFGILKYSESLEMDLTESGTLNFFNQIIKDPMGRLDHNQVIHRRFTPPQLWQEDIGTVMNVDGWYFNRLACSHEFHPINAWAAVKRLHGKNLQNAVGQYQAGMLDDLRE